VWASGDVACVVDIQQDGLCLADYVFAVPRYKTHPKENLGWATLRVSLHPAKHSELICADEMAAAILLVAGFTGFGAERLFFAVADGAEAIGGDAQRD
jgi:hypothetical protein